MGTMGGGGTEVTTCRINRKSRAILCVVGPPDGVMR